jgi:transcriptional regulator with XRE-family HTH domain
VNQNVGFRIEHRIKTWGEALMRCRVRRDFSHKDLADRLNVSKAQIKAWENNEGQPDALQLKKLYASISWLRGFEGLLEQPHGLSVGARPPEPSAPPPTPAERASIAEIEAPEAPPKSFGEALRRQRLKEGLDQDDLGELVGVSGPIISNWELGKHYMVRENFDKLCTLMPELRAAPMPFARSIAKPVGWPRSEETAVLADRLVESAVQARLQVENLPPIDQVAGPGAGAQMVVDREALAYGRALLEVALARAALAAAQERLRLAESNGALQEGMLKEAANRVARETNEPGEGQS